MNQHKIPKYKFPLFGLVSVAVAMLFVSGVPVFAQNPDEPLRDARISLPGSFALGAQEYNTGYSVLSGSTTFSANPIVIRDAFDENDRLRRSVVVEHLSFSILGLADLEANSGAQIYSVYYNGTRIATHQRGPSGFLRLAAGPGLYLGDSVAELALTGNIAYGYGYDFPNFTIGAYLEANLGLIFFDVDTAVYSGGGFGIYLTRRQDLTRGRVRDLPADYDQEQS